MFSNPGSPQITIGFKKLEILCLIGTIPEEKVHVQKIYLTVSAALETPPIESLSSTIDYNVLADLCRRTCQMRHRELLETLAQDLRNALTENFPIRSLKIEIEKSSAIQDADCAFVELTQEMAVCAGR